MEKSDATMLTCNREFPCFTARGVKFLKGTHFYHDPGGLDIFCIWSGGQEIFLPLGVAHVKFSRWEGGYWKGVT